MGKQLKSVADHLSEIVYGENRLSHDTIYTPEPVTFDDELAALEMTSSSCAIPARWVD